MNESFEKRLFLAFLISSIFILISYYFLPKPALQVKQQAGQVAEEKKSSFLIEDFIFKTNVIAMTNRIQTENMAIDIDTFGGRIVDTYINGKWNQTKKPIKLYWQTNPFKSGDLFFGPLELQKIYSIRSFYDVEEKTERKIVLATKLNYKGKSFILRKSYEILDDYQLKLEVFLENTDKVDLELNFDGKAFSIPYTFGFNSEEEQNSGNIIQAEYFNKKIQKVLKGGLFKKRPHLEEIFSPDWMAVYNNHFIVIINPLFTNYTSKFLLENEKKLYSEIVMATELPAITLKPGEKVSFKTFLYIGPKSERILSKIDKAYRKIFAWPLAFNWFMKPIEWGMYYIAHIIAGLVKSWGLTIILLALVIKLMLSPLSVQAAISIKKSNMLQPKLKKLQEKYGDDPKLLNQKVAELYKKEKVNPLGGCLPLLLQFPVFFVLYRVLSSSVELKGSQFLWIKDLTLPDTLFKININIPFIPSSFNLLPLIMTVVQIFQMKIQSMRNPAAKEQQLINTYLLPIFFLFIFWNMPSGLVLYWTVQNVFSIIEQEIINYIKIEQSA